MQRTSGDATATSCFLYFVYIHLRPPQALPVTGMTSDPLGSPQLGFALVGDDDECAPLDPDLIERPVARTVSGLLLVADRRDPLVRLPMLADAQLGRPINFPA